MVHASLFHISKLSEVSKWHLPMVICHFVHQLPFPSKPKETSGSSRGQASLAPHYRPTEQSVRRCDGGRILRAPRFCASIRSSIFLILLGDIWPTLTNLRWSPWPFLVFRKMPWTIKPSKIYYHTMAACLWIIAQKCRIVALDLPYSTRSYGDGIHGRPPHSNLHCVNANTLLSVWNGSFSPWFPVIL